MTPPFEDRPRKVCLVAPRFAPYIGGVETHVEQIAIQLAARGEQVEVVTQATREVIADAGPVEHRDGFVVRRCALPGRVPTDFVSVGMVRALQTTDAEVIHAHNYHALPAACAAAVAGSRVFVLTPHYHGAGSTRLRSALHHVYQPLMGKRAIDRAEAIVAVSPSEKSLLVRDFGERVGRRTLVVPNGVSIPPERVVAREEGLILFVGRLDGYKRVDTLIRAVTLLPETFRLAIVGDGPQRAQLTEQVARLGLPHRVVLTGRISRSELANWVARASVFATASQLEAFGLTMADAVAAGLPIVASDIPAHRDVLNTAFPVTLPPDVLLVRHRPDSRLAGSAFATAIKAVSTAVRQPIRPHQLVSWSDVGARLADLYQSLCDGTVARGKKLAA